MGKRGPVRTWTPIKRALIESSIWRASAEVRVLWVTMLIIASEPGRGGEIDMELDLLAARARLPVDETEKALAVLMSPDPRSRSRNDEGRRVALIDPSRPWGWRLINWQRHRIDARSWTSDKEDGPPWEEVETPRNSPKLPKLPETSETSTERKGKEMKGKEGRPAPRDGLRPSSAEWLEYAKEILPVWPLDDLVNAFDHYEAVGWKIGTKPVKDWRACARTCSRRWLASHPGVDPARVIL